MEYQVHCIVGSYILVPFRKCIGSASEHTIYGKNIQGRMLVWYFDHTVYSSISIITANYLQLNNVFAYDAVKI